MGGYPILRVSADGHDVLVTGEEDAIIGPEVGRELAAAIPDARFLLVERAGHLSSLERPEVVNEALLDFLAPIWV